MSPDDPRHGTLRGHSAGCREACCRRAMARYEKGRRFNKARGISLAVPAHGTQRRIQALMTLGWTTTDIAHAIGWSGRNRVLQILKGQQGKPCRWVERRTHDRVAELYAAWCMTPPELTPIRARSKRAALRLGYAPPLAWDDIDDIDEQPQGLERVGHTTEIRATRAADLEHFAHMGDTLETACERLDVNPDTLWKWCNRHGHADLYERLAERTRRGANQWTEGRRTA